MNSIDRVELRIPLTQLVHDVSVERGHVVMLKSSIQQVGQLSPILVWEQGNNIIDGFHRVEALRELGGKQQSAT